MLNLKNNRQCGMPPYPIYPMPGMMGQPMMPGIQTNMQPGMQAMPSYRMPPTGMPTTPSTGQISGNMEQQLSRMQQQINMIERRVSQLETSVNELKTVPYSSDTKYNNTGYHMM